MDESRKIFMYSVQTPYAKQYLAYPNYVAYTNVIDGSVKSGPYYTTSPRQQCLPIIYNYVQPSEPAVAPLCYINPRLEYWYTPQ